MVDIEKHKFNNTVNVHAVPVGPTEETVEAIRHADDVLLAQLGYKSEFKREFSVSRLSVLLRPILTSLNSESRL